MKTESVRSKKRFENTIEHYNVQIDQRLSDLNFISDEIRFFKKVVHNYVKGTDPEIIEKIEQVKKEISEVEEKSRVLRSEVLGYADVIEKKGTSEAEIPTEVVLNQKLNYLQSRFNYLNRDIRQLKEDLFSIVEDIYGN